MMEIENLFDLNESIDWINENSFKCIALQLPIYLLKYSTDLVDYLNSRLNGSSNGSSNGNIEFYVIVLNCCSVDYVSPRHLNGQIDAIIRFGKCCLASLPISIIDYPVLFVFENQFLNEQANDFLSNYLNSDFESKDALLIVDTNFLIPFLKLINFEVSIAKYIKFTDQWTLTKKFKNYFIELSSENSSKDVASSQDQFQNSINCSSTTLNRFYNFFIDQNLTRYKRLFYVGDRIPNSFKILNQLEIVHLNPVDCTINRIQSNKELMKRCSLIEKIKKMNRFGFVFSHSYPDVNPLIDEIKRLAKIKRKQINFITLVQTTDEFKLGNFASLQSLVLISNCYCSFLIDTINLHIPLINYDEFRISCGLKLDYGQVKWNDDATDENDLHLNDDDEMSNQLILDDRKTALVESYFKRDDQWFGLQVNAGEDEISDLKQGLKGIAMSYGLKGDGDCEMKR